MQKFEVVKICINFVTSIIEEAISKNEIDVAYAAISKIQAVFDLCDLLNLKEVKETLTHDPLLEKFDNFCLNIIRKWEVENGKS